MLRGAFFIVMLSVVMLSFMSPARINLINNHFSHRHKINRPSMLILVNRIAASFLPAAIILAQLVCPLNVIICFFTIWNKQPISLETLVMM